MSSPKARATVSVMFDEPWIRFTLLWGGAILLVIWGVLRNGDPMSWMDDEFMQDPFHRFRRPRQVPQYSLEERLAMLDDLRDREVIGPDEYAARRQRILESER